MYYSNALKYFTLQLKAGYTYSGFCLSLIN